MLIANRGEIALRIIRTCRELGIRTVAVHSTADTHSLPVRLADESICIGPPESAQSYLHVPSIISAAEVTDAEAIHPGYGFLAENAAFAEICQACGITFIGPSPRAIRLAGDKAQARELARQSGVSVLPGSEGPLKDEAEALRLAEEIGFPVIVKASAGGGGRGMRIIKDRDALAQTFVTCQSEAAAAFGSSEVYLERYIEEARHIEVQLLGDHHGALVHLGERDCSVQRRHQKLLEESPSPFVTPELRLSLGEAALRLAQAADFWSAGTVEFLVDGAARFYFLEMNTRIQVEHPVTEMVTGLDLIREQIRVAAGEPLGFSQADVHFMGHAVECRINAEDPVSFTPAPGKITGWLPPGGLGVRVDSAAYAGLQVQPHYDSLIAKLIVHGRDRAEAIARMQRALQEFTVEGIPTTIPFHLRLLSLPEFLRGEATTDLLERIWN